MVNEEDLLAQFIALYDKASSCNVAELCRLDNEKRKREGTRLECPTIPLVRNGVHQVRTVPLICSFVSLRSRCHCRCYHHHYRDGRCRADARAAAMLGLRGASGTCLPGRHFRASSEHGGGASGVSRPAQRGAGGR